MIEFYLHFILPLNLITILKEINAEMREKLAVYSFCNHKFINNFHFFYYEISVYLLINFRLIGDLFMALIN